MSTKLKPITKGVWVIDRYGNQGVAVTDPFPTGDEICVAVEWQTQDERRIVSHRRVDDLAAL